MYRFKTILYHGKISIFHIQDIVRLIFFFFLMAVYKELQVVKDVILEFIWTGNRGTLKLALYIGEIGEIFQNKDFGERFFRSMRRGAIFGAVEIL